jgi:hypothetical protein
LTLIFLRTGSAAIQSDSFCQFWIIFDYAFFTGGLWTMATATIERYWLIFHRAFFDKHILILHYIPIILCMIYPLTLYSSIVTRYPCINTFDYSSWTCGGACYLYEVRYRFQNIFVTYLLIYKKNRTIFVFRQIYIYEIEDIFN